MPDSVRETVARIIDPELVEANMEPPYNPKSKVGIALAKADAILAALPGWLPIETAPKDGTEVLVYWPRMAIDDDGEVTGEVAPGPGHIGVSTNSQGGWEPDNVVEANGGYFGDDFEFGEPTQWQPLPSPPQTTQPGERG